MKTKTIILSVCTIVLSTLLCIADVPAQEKAEENEAQQIQQKITTPPLQLTEEEDKRTPLPKSTKEEEKELPEGEAPKAKPAVGVKVEEKIPAAGGVEEIKIQEEVKFEPTPIKTSTKIELILDASGSMNGLMGQSTKMAILKMVVNDIISQPLPEGAEREIGLRVYGSEKPSEEGDCKDSQLLIPIEPLDKKLFKEKVDGITTQGVTPIGFALEEAAGDFEVSPNVDNVIILVTDGADSCNADLCQIAQKIHTDLKKIMVHVLGFDLDQSASSAVECVAKNADGQFVRARNENELMASLDQLLMANIPYNLRLKVMSGATPLPSTLKVYKSGTKKLVREDESPGIKYYQLPPGTYDIEITYTDSIEKPPPSKLLKGVEVQTTSKAEQVVQFDLGMLTLTAFDQEGAPIAATYVLRKKEDPNVLASFKSEPGPHTTWLTEGTYSAKVQAVTDEGLKLTASADALKITTGGSLTHDFQFQMGNIKLVGKDAKGELLPISYKVTPAGDDTKVTLEGSATAEGKVIDLPPGKYDIYLSVAVEGMKSLPAEKLEEIDLAGGDMLEKAVELPAATLTLIGKDDKGNKVETLFSIKPNLSEDEPVEFTSINEPISLILPPGRYDIKAIFVNSEYSPKPVISWDALVLANDQRLEKEALFKFGTLRLFSRNSDGAPVNSTFYIYKVVDEPLITLNNISSWTDVKLTEGFYDIRADNLMAKSDPKPSVWFHNVEIKPEQPTSREAIFTHGLLKMACRGPNNIVLECDYRVFTYGTDSPMFEGTTGKRWETFDILPGSYYIEAGYHDAKDEVLLKKWITIRVKDNQMLEQVIRF